VAERRSYSEYPSYSERRSYSEYGVEKTPPATFAYRRWQHPGLAMVQSLRKLSVEGATPTPHFVDALPPGSPLARLSSIASPRLGRFSSG
jgi:hypothetical protein